MKTLLILLYLWAGDVKLEQIPTASVTACEKAFEARIEELEKEPKFENGLYATCIQRRVVEAAK